MFHAGRECVACHPLRYHTLTITLTNTYNNTGTKPVHICEIRTSVNVGKITSNLVPLVFIPYCAGLTKRATSSSLIGFINKTNGRKYISRSSSIIHLKVGHGQPEVGYFQASNRMFPGSLVS